MYTKSKKYSYPIGAPINPGRGLKALCHRLGPKYHLASIDGGDVIHRVIGEGWDVEIYSSGKGYNIALWGGYGGYLIETQEDVPANKVASALEEYLY